MEEPRDRYKLVCIGFTILGVTTLLPWNFFITATDYWMYKFRNVTTTTPEFNYFDRTQTEIHQHGGPATNSNGTNRTMLQTFFESYLAIAANLPMTITMVLNSLYGQRFSQKLRLYVSLSVMLFVFILTTIFVKIDTDQMQNLFFALTMVMVVVVSAFSAIFQAAIFGIVASFPNNCMHAMVNGQAVAGLSAVAIQILSMLNNSSATESGTWYFMVSTLFIAFAILCYWLMDNDYTRYYLQQIPEYHRANNNQQATSILQDTDDHLTNSISIESSSLIETIRECWQMAATVICAFWASLAVFPAVCVLILPQYPNTSIFTGKFYTPITTFILFNFADLCGRLCSTFIPFPNDKKNTLLILTLARIIFPISILFCNVQPRNYTPVWFKSDIYFPIFNSLSALTNGYLFSSAMVMASCNSSRERLELTGFIMASALGIGLTLGSITSTLLLRVI